MNQGNGELRKRITNGVDKVDEIKNESKNTKGNTKTIGLVFVSLLLDLLAFTMILPLLPSLLDYYNREEGKGNSLYASLLRGVQGFQKITGAPDQFASVLFGGALGSMYSFLQFLTSPIVGSLSDAYGRKPMLLICLVGITISHGLWSCASTFSIFVLARFIGGLSKANVSLMLQGGAARRLGARGAEVAARGALALTPASFLSVAFAAMSHPPLLVPIYWLWIGLVLFALSTAFAVSCMTSMAAGKAPEEARGAVLGTLRSLGALARAAGPLLASSEYENWLHHLANKVGKRQAGPPLAVCSPACKTDYAALRLHIILVFRRNDHVHHRIPNSNHSCCDKMPLFSNKFSPKTIPVRKQDTSVLKKELGSDYASKELSLDVGPLKLKLGDFEISFEDGQWIPASGKAGAAHKENIRLKNELERLEEENNMLRLKFEILLDMMTDKTVEAEQQAELQRAQSLGNLKQKGSKKKW
ncbi:hypothetical protein B5X24_HaOG209240 [Helicoverpa armigera]|nr:hypothetical protein B5X24_HaOG209240 [Helicoverpa armigera]